MVHDKLPESRRLAIGCGDPGGAVGGDAANRASGFSTCFWMPRQLHEYQACSNLRLLPQSKHPVFFKLCDGNLISCIFSVKVYCAGFP